MTIIVDQWISGIAVGWLIFCGVCCVVATIRLGFMKLTLWAKQRWAEELRRQAANLLRVMSAKGVKFDSKWADREWYKSPAGFDYAYGLDKGDGPDRTVYTMRGNWTPEDIEDLKRYSLKGEAAKYLGKMAFPGDATGAFDTEPYSARRYDWRAPESALAWGVLYHPDSGYGCRVEVVSANGHVIMDSTEWYMIMDLKERWDWDILMADVYGPIMRNGLRQVHAQEEELLFGNTAWAEPESALAWGILRRKADGKGWRSQVVPANGHILLDSSEMLMILEYKTQWEQDLINAALVTQNLFPRYVMRPEVNLPPVMRHLRPSGNPPHPDDIEMWHWNDVLQEWEAWK